MKLKNHTLFAAFLISTSLFLSTQVLSQEVEDEKEFDYNKGSDKGPENWGKLHKEWSACGNGNIQSPIDLLDEKVEVLHHLGRLNRSYKASKASLKNRGHDIMVLVGIVRGENLNGFTSNWPCSSLMRNARRRKENMCVAKSALGSTYAGIVENYFHSLYQQLEALLEWEDGAGEIYMNGTAYILKQCHWHSPSEHTIDGRSYSLEVHMVHESVDRKIAVVGILYKMGRPDTFLTELMGHIRAIADRREAKEEVGIADPRHIKLGSRKYYRYKGSLTTPPCTEGVIWTIIKKVRTVSREQVKLLRDAVHDGYEWNARPTQPTNYRTVQLYRPRKL